ncbi:MAG: cation transporter [Bacteroidales bacterium]|nr:cation transporter [Bacteroidales bacterium]
MKESEDHIANRSNRIVRTSAIGIAANILLATFKATVGLLAGSVAIVMDAVNNLSDALSSVITIIGAKLSIRPADRKHPFGHGRIEYFSAIIIAVIVLMAGTTSLIESVKKIITPTLPHYTTWTLLVIIVAIVVKLLLGRYVKKQGERLRSDALTASGSDALFDAIITLSTLLSAGIMLLWGISLDGILGTLISLVIIKAGIEMLASPVNELLGARLPQQLVSDLKREVMAYPEVHGVYDITLHNYGPEVLIGSLHISVDDTLDAYRIHGLTRKIADDIFQRHGIILTIGIYAVSTGDNRRTALQNIVIETLGKHDGIVQIHGFYYYEDENRLSVDIVPDIAIHDEQAFRQQLTDTLKAKLPDVAVSIVIDHNYSA